MLIFCDFIQVYVFTTNHHLNGLKRRRFCPYQGEGKLIIGVYGENGEKINPHRLQALIIFSVEQGSCYLWPKK